MIVLTDNSPVKTDGTACRYHSPSVDTHVSRRHTFFLPAQPPVARSYDDEKQSFLSMLPVLRRSHPGKHVIIANGAVADSDESRRELVRRFFGPARQLPVYIGFVGTRPVIKAPTPLIRRRSNQ